MALDEQTQHTQQNKQQQSAATVAAAPAVPAVDMTPLTGAGKAGTHGLAFVNVNPLGANDTDATDRDTTGWAAKWQWNLFIPPQGPGKPFAFGGVVYVPWGNTRVPDGTPRIPYGAALAYHKPRAARTAADVAADFTNVGDGTTPPCVGGIASAGNWTYINLVTVARALGIPEDLAAKVVGRGGGCLDDAASPHYAYLPGENDVPGTYSVPPGVGGISAGYKQANNSLAQDNPVMVRLDITKMPTDAGYLAAVNVPLVMYNAYHQKAQPSSVYGSLGGWVDAMGGRFKGERVGNRVYWAPVMHQSGRNANQPCMTFLSLDVTNPDAFTTAEPWGWMDFRNPPPGTSYPDHARYFGGFQGSMSEGNVVYCVQSVPGKHFWALDTSVGDGGFVGNDGKPNVAANPAAWKHIDPCLIHGHAGISGYLNAGAVTDKTTGHRCILYCPFAPHGSPRPNPFAVLYDTTLPFDQKSSWKWLDITTIPVTDQNLLRNHPAPQTMGYQGAAQLSSGHTFLMPTWNEAGNHQSNWLCWPPGQPFDTAASWRDVPSYAVFGDPQQTLGIWGCDLCRDPDSDTIFAALFGGGPPGANTGRGCFPNKTGTGGVLCAFTPTLL